MLLLSERLFQSGRVVNFKYRGGWGGGEWLSGLSSKRTTLSEINSKRAIILLSLVLSAV